MSQMRKKFCLADDITDGKQTMLNVVEKELWITSLNTASFKKQSLSTVHKILYNNIYFFVIF